MNKYQPVIGLEIHVELKTKSKMFCQCSANYFGKKPNTNTCPVCLGLPGALPVPNKKAVEWTILLGKALNCTINKVTKFDRKHYFYPDLPKGYQISQYDQPIAVKGEFKVQGLKFKITRVHLEEDTGKLIHLGGETLVDFNRSGVPLVEIVTEPVFNNADQVKNFLEGLRTLVRYLDISDADMEKGSMRLEPNISLIKLKTQYSKSKTISQGLKLPNYKVEVKNINSFKYVKQAIEYEIKRQTEILKKEETPKQETRGFDEKKTVTYSQRTKEEARDYRYFPEPDIPTLEFEDKYLASIYKQIPELPQAKMNRFIGKLNLKPIDAFILTRDRKLAEYYEQVISKLKTQNSKLNLKSENLNQFIANLIINKKISTNLFVEEFVEKLLEQFTPKDTDQKLLDATIIRIIVANKKVVDDYKSGKKNAIMFLVGQVMRAMKGKADARLVVKIIKDKLT